MQLKSTLAVYVLAIGSLILLNSGCNGNKTGEASFGSLNITPPPPPVTSAPEGSSNGLESDDYFYVGVDTTNDAIFHVHKDTDFKESCSIKKDPFYNFQLFYNYLFGKRAM